MKPFMPARIVGGAVVVERDPFAFEATASYRGVELGWAAAPRGTPFRDPPPRSMRRVVVREPHEFVRGEEHFLTLFQRSVVETAALAGTAAPQLLHTFGRDGQVHALVVEHVDGVAVDQLVDALRVRGEVLAIPVALAIAATLVGMWQVPADRQQLVPIHLGLADVRISPSGWVRVLPELASEQARQTVGAAAEIFAGNVAYISPEQIVGEYGVRSGMFTLGLLLHELLTGAYPFGERAQTSMFELLSRIHNDDVPVVDRRRGVPSSVTAFVARATARIPADRFASWAELADALAAVRAAFAPVGPADLLAALRVLPAALQPVAAPELDPSTFVGWESLPHDGLVAVTILGHPREVALPPVPTAAQVLAPEAMRASLWVWIEDQYDRDRYRVGPFPRVADAHAYCDAVNGAQLEVPSTGLPATIDAPKTVGVWNLAEADGYPFEARALAMLRDPATIPRDPDAILRRVGARPESEWIADLHRDVSPAACWCAELIADRLPEVEPNVLAAYLSEGIEPERALGSTPQHHGDLDLARCRLCRGPIVHLVVEHEGLPDAIGHYYTPVTADDVGSIERGLAREELEAWVGQRAGIYRQGFAARCYRKVRVGYVGIDHALDVEPG